MMHRQMRYVFWGLVCFLVCVVPSMSHAQFTLPNTENSVFISLLPEHPTPGSAVHLRARSSIIDLQNSAITWYVNNKVVASGTGLVEATVVAGTLGSNTAISVSAETETASASGKAVITPTIVDLLWESDSYTPPFYAGRSLPSAGSKLHLQALAWFRRSNGSAVSPADIIYTWRRDGEVLGDISGRGRSSVVIDAPQLFGANTISVDALSADNTLSGSALARIESTEPILTLYKDHPLFGVMYNDALGTQAFTPENEMTFMVVPYFAPTVTALDTNLTYDWQVNGKKVETDRVRPNEITINSAGSSGDATISVALTHLTNFFMSAAGSWNISLSSTGPGNNHNTNGPNLFHPQE